MLDIKVGADPEFFVETNGSIIPAVNMVAGTKYDPLACIKGAMQVDGLALEFNIDPATSEDEFVEHIVTVRDQTLNAAKANSGLDLMISRAVGHRFGMDTLRNLPREATILGCEFDYRMDGRRNNTSEEEAQDYRCTGGHVHIGWGEDMDVEERSGHFIDTCGIAKLCWYLLEKPLRLKMYFDAVSEGNQRDAIQAAHADVVRQGLYGGNGAFRPKSYGMEYRGLSNAWIHEERYIRYVYRRVQLIMVMVQEGILDDQTKMNNLGTIHFNPPASEYQARYSAERSHFVDAYRRFDPRITI
ncbi:hypothetical protein NVP1208B_56 [Vibrio phage 1.208.B._10N.222.52.A7]|nr:hypothetical protein NVP1208B_56 [Vibrio phage 1.208.B._10N.222.52.A7]